MSHKSATSSGTSPQPKGAGSGLSGTPPPPRVPSARTCPKYDGTLNGPQRPLMRIGSTPPHTHLAKPPTQGDVVRGLLKPAGPLTNGLRHAKPRRAWLMAHAPRRHHNVHYHHTLGTSPLRDTTQTSTTGRISPCDDDCLGFRV